MENNSTFTNLVISFLDYLSLNAELLLLSYGLLFILTIHFISTIFFAKGDSQKNQSTNDWRMKMSYLFNPNKKKSILEESYPEFVKKYLLKIKNTKKGHMEEGSSDFKSLIPNSIKSSPKNDKENIFDFITPPKTKQSPRRQAAAQHYRSSEVHYKLASLVEENHLKYPTRKRDNHLWK